MIVLFLILIFFRPFISSLAFPTLNILYSCLFMLYSAVWLVPKKIPLAKLSKIKYPLALFLLSLALSIAFSSNRPYSLIEMYKYLGGILIFIIAAALDEKERNLLIRALVLSGFIVGILSIYQYLFIFDRLSGYLARNHSTDLFTMQVISQKRTFLPFVNPNALGGYLILIIPIVFINTDKQQPARPGNRIGPWNKFIAFLLILSLALTKSVGAALSIFLAVVLYLYLKDKLNKRILAVIGLFLAIAALFVIRTLCEKAHFQTGFSILTRIAYWKESLDIIKEFILTGVGIGNFNLPNSRFAHNSYLQICAEMGILGLLSFLAMNLMILRAGFRKLEEKENGSSRAFLILAAISFLIHNVIDFTFFLPEISFIWWAIAGLLI